MPYFPEILVRQGANRMASLTVTVVSWSAGVALQGRKDSAFHQVATHMKI